MASETKIVPGGKREEGGEGKLKKEIKREKMKEENGRKFKKKNSEKRK